MSEYRIFETDEFVKAIGKMPHADATFIQAKLATHVYSQLRQMPFHGPNIKKLRGYNPETWRYRIGRYRLFFQVDEKVKIVFILTVDKRNDAYR